MCNYVWRSTKFDFFPQLLTKNGRLTTIYIRLYVGYRTIEVNVSIILDMKTPSVYVHLIRNPSFLLGIQFIEYIIIYLF